jgi:hypothetical protein
LKLLHLVMRGKRRRPEELLHLLKEGGVLLTQHLHLDLELLPVHRVPGGQMGRHRFTGSGDNGRHGLHDVLGPDGHLWGWWRLWLEMDTASFVEGPHWLLL